MIAVRSLALMRALVKWSIFQCVSTFQIPGIFASVIFYFIWTFPRAKWGSGKLEMSSLQLLGNSSSSACGRKWRGQKHFYASLTRHNSFQKLREIRSLLLSEKECFPRHLLVPYLICHLPSILTTVCRPLSTDASFKQSFPAVRCIVEPFFIARPILEERYSTLLDNASWVEQHIRKEIK